MATGTCPTPDAYMHPEPIKIPLDDLDLIVLFVAEHIATGCHWITLKFKLDDGGESIH